MSDMELEKDFTILIIETDPSISAGLKRKIKGMGYGFSTSRPEKPIDQLEALDHDMAILGPSLETETCFKCIQKLRIIDPLLPILTSCEDGCLSREPAALFEGVHYIGPGLEKGDISEAIKEALEHRTECESLPDFPALIGQGREIKEIRREIQNASKKDITILITGETGTGKELIARSIHYHSPRNRGPLVKINCSALPDDLLESEIFGFQKGAFTGAYKDKPGRLEMADGGTLFIDEIGALSLSIQVKFLQVLEDREFSRLGGISDKIIDTRVVAATNSNLWEKVREGSFRNDLFYRLNVLHIKAPPLRERKDDISLLGHYFLNKYCFEFKKELMDVPEEITNIFLAYPWPGNVREFENVIRRAIVLRDWNFIFKEFDLENMQHQGEHHDTVSAKDSPFSAWGNEKLNEIFGEKNFSLKKICRAYVSEAERRAILKSLKETQWNRKKAAQTLGVSYKTLLNRIEEFGLEP